MLKSPSEIIRGGWELYAKNWRKFMPFLILLVLPSLLLPILGVLGLYLEVYIPKTSFVSNLIIMAVYAAGMLFAFWISIALARAVAMAAGNQPFDWKNVFSTSSDLIWPVLWTTVIVILIVFGGSLLLVVPGLIFAVWYNFTFYTVIFENKRGMNALRASKDMVAGRWWAILWRWLAQGLVFGILNLAKYYELAFLIRLIPMPMFLEASLVNIISSLVSIITTPLMAGSAFILYQSAKENPVTQQSAPTPPAQP